MRTLLPLLFLFTCPIPLDAYFGLTSAHKYSNNSMTRRTLCTSLGLRGRQFKNCKSSPKVSKTLAEAMEMSRRECTHLFRHERWNCDYNETYRTQLITKDFKESAFLFALSAASLVHSVARACAEKAFSSRCRCYEAPTLQQRRRNLKHDVCDANLPFAVRYVRRFLTQQHAGSDAHSAIVRHNVYVGIEAVIDSNTTTNECPWSVYGAQLCARDESLLRLKLAPFRTVSKRLKKSYKHAQMVRTNNNKVHGLKRLTRARLAYGAESPDFCTRSRYSPGTSGRICRNHKSCARICCSSNYAEYQTEKRTFCCRMEISGCCKPVCVKKCEKLKRMYRCR